MRTKSVIKRYTTEVWDPRSTGRLRWDAVVVVCVLYNCMVLPFRIGFGDDEFGPLSVLELMVDVMFITDIFVNFRTGYFTFDKEEDEYILVLKQPQAMYHYAKTWFFFDLVSSLPVDLLLLFNMKSKTLLYLRFPRMLRLLRLPRLFRYLNRWEQQIGISRQAFRMAKTLSCCLSLPTFRHACSSSLPSSWTSRTPVGSSRQTSRLSPSQSSTRTLCSRRCLIYTLYRVWTNRRTGERHGGLFDHGIDVYWCIVLHYPGWNDLLQLGGKGHGACKEERSPRSSGTAKEAAGITFDQREEYVCHTKDKIMISILILQHVNCSRIHLPLGGPLRAGPRRCPRGPSSSTSFSSLACPS